MVRLRYFENLYHNRSELENIKNIWKTYLMIDMHIKDGRGGPFLFANISKTREDNENP